MELHPPRGHSPIPISYDQQAADDARRYEDFSTVDWVQDTLLERKRRLMEAGSRPRTTGSNLSLWLRHTLVSCESWFVFSLVGATIGLNAAISSIVTVWLSDLKLGYCTAGWWLNRKFCCWEMGETLNETGTCSEWRPWTEYDFVQWIVYVVLAGVFAYICTYLVKSLAPYAAGSGISEIKCVIAGFSMKGFLSPATLLLKSVCLPIAIASGLSVGKEGPSVHVACCTGHVVASLFKRFRRSEAKMREMVTASSAAGVAVAFGSPIGGVLFSLEEMSTNLSVRTMWRGFVTALVSTVFLSAMNPFRTGKLVLFQVHFDRDWHYFEIPFFALIGVFGGLYGGFVIKYNLMFQAFRRKHLANHGVAEGVILAVLTASICYMNKFLRIDMNESLDILFRECERGDYENLCQTWAQWRMVNSLLLATVLRTMFIIISYGCKVPAGIFVPSMAVGATFGRMMGILVKALYRANPDWSIFSACDPTKPCITPGTYALLGAAAGLSGITRLTVTVVVIMFELTGALTYILPTMIVVLVTKTISDQFHKGGIADQMIRFNGFPFLENNDDHVYNIAVAPVMRRNLTFLPSKSLKLHELEYLLSNSNYQSFPIVVSNDDQTLLGDVTRRDLNIAIQRAHIERMVALTAVCVFADQEGPNQMLGTSYDADAVLDFTSYVNPAPITASPKQPLEIIMQLFKRLGPRVIYVESHGKLVGLITVKDCLKYTLAKENEENDYEGGTGDEVENTLQDLRLWMEEIWGGIMDMIRGPDRHRVRLGGGDSSNARNSTDR